MTMLTEDEAKTKWCPFARESAVNPSMPWNGPIPTHPTLNCIASACMAWRFGRRVGEANMTTRGYCGLARKPRDYAE